MIRRPPRSTQSRSSAASDVYKRQTLNPQGSALEASPPVLGWRREPTTVVRPSEELSGGPGSLTGLHLQQPHVPQSLHTQDVQTKPATAQWVPSPDLSLIHISEPTRPY
eukprot:TRINITY_DN1652_c0_g1_i3.p1 TRINITY_DN1652_c0_g1~~TRINITY_DN1652_c0_g1_i3.p1  ORF type:complete len:109 (+),score=40.23 TRINITY_DN1652_c0_g1_i3:124-450(+)